MDSIASRLASARQKKGWTQAKLAEVAGVSQGTVGNIESGVRRSHGSLPRLAEALDVSHNWLRDGEAPITLQTIDTNQPVATNGEASGQAVMRSAVNILVICLQEMDEESRKEAGHLLQEMAASPAGRWSGRLAELIEKESTPRLWENVGIYDRAGKYSLGTSGQQHRMTPKGGSQPSAAVAASHLPTGQDNASTGADRDKDQGRGSSGTKGSG